MQDGNERQVWNNVYEVRNHVAEHYVSISLEHMWFGGREKANELINDKHDAFCFTRYELDYDHTRERFSWTLYPPYGKRGCGSEGAVRYGLDSEPFFYGEGHVKMCRFVQSELESDALDAERIASVPYLDGCILGMHDLLGSIGRLGDVFCEENLALARMAIKAF